MNYKGKRFVKILLLSLLISYTTSFGSMTIYPSAFFKSSDYKFNMNNYSEDVSKDLSLILNFLEQYHNGKNIEQLINAINLFSNLPVKMTDLDIKSMNREDVFDYIFYSIRDEIYNLSSNEQLEKMIIYYAEKIFLGWRIHKEIDVYGNRYLIEGLVNFNKEKNNNCQQRLDYLEFLYKYFLENVDIDYDSGVIPDIDIENSGGDLDSDSSTAIPSNPDYNFTPNENNSSDVGQNGIVTDNAFSGLTNGKFVDYKKIGTSCYKVSTEYKDGKEVSKRKILLPKSEFVKCGIYDFVHSTIKKPIGNIIIDKEYIYGDQNKDSKYSIFYTVNKASKNPYYYDTGIRASIDKSVSYNQLKDSLYQLAVKTEGYSILDNDKQLVVLEGKPIVLKSQKDKYSKSEVERLLNSFNNVGLKIMEHSENRYSTSLENMLILNKIVAISIDGEKIDLSISAILNDDAILLPIHEIFMYLGADTSLKEDALLVHFNNIRLKIVKDKILYLENEKEKSFNTPPIIKDNVFYAEISPIAESLGYNVLWDSDLGELIFSSVKKES